MTTTNHRQHTESRREPLPGALAELCGGTRWLPSHVNDPHRLCPGCSDCRVLSSGALCACGHGELRHKPGGCDMYCQCKAYDAAPDSAGMQQAADDERLAAYRAGLKDAGMQQAADGTERLMRAVDVDVQLRAAILREFRRMQQARVEFRLREASGYIPLSGWDGRESYESHRYTVLVLLDMLHGEIA